jgi:hypothetical protein
MRIRLFAVLGVSVLVSSAAAQWEVIVPGIEYRRFDLPGPVQAFVARMDLANGASREIDSMIASGQFYKSGLPYQGRETVSQMVARYDDQINFYYQIWGQRNDVVVGINGDYWETVGGGGYSGRPASGQVQGGWFCRRFDEFAGGSGFFWTIWGVPHLGGDVRNSNLTPETHQTVTFADDSVADLTGINIERDSSDLMLYTPQWDGSTHTDNSGVEVLARVNRPALPLPNQSPGSTNYSCTGTILEVRNGQGNTPIPFDCIVLSGTGSNATTLLNRCVVGQTVRLRMTILDYGFSGRTPPHPSQDWTKAYGACGVDRELVIDSTVTNLPSPAWPRDPRTAVCFNSSHTYFVVVDGRRSGSIGMDATELANFMINDLGATTGCSLDGGGSSAMWVQGRGIVNVPSDGSERAVTNGLMMVAVEPRELSTALVGGDPIHTATATQMRLGPGTTFDLVANVPADSHGPVADHALNGVRATGGNWIYWDWNGQTGWTPQSALVETTAVNGWRLY